MLPCSVFFHLFFFLLIPDLSAFIFFIRTVKNPYHQARHGAQWWSTTQRSWDLKVGSKNKMQLLSTPDPHVPVPCLTVAVSCEPFQTYSTHTFTALLLALPHAACCSEPSSSHLMCLGDGAILVHEDPSPFLSIKYAAIPLCG